MWVWEVRSAQLARQGLASGEGELRYSSLGSLNVTLPPSSQSGEKYTLRNNSFCCSLTKSNFHQEHGPDLWTAAAGNNQTLSLFSIWSESRAEFYEFSDALQHFLATIKYCS